MLKYKRPNNVHVVYYDEVSHAKKKDPDYKYLKSAMVNPLKPIRNTFYNDMTKLAHAIVRVEPTGTKATVERFHRPAWIPGPWLNLVSGVTIGYQRLSWWDWLVKSVLWVPRLLPAGWLPAGFSTKLETIPSNMRFT